MIIHNEYVRSLIILGFSNPQLLVRRAGHDLKRVAADYLSYFGYYKDLPKIIFIAGMALSGSTWMKNLFARVPGVFTRPMPMPSDVEYKQNICDSAFSHFPKYGHTLVKTHLNPLKENIECIHNNGVDKVLVTYRDLRDVVVSHYYRLIEIPKNKESYDYKDYKAMGKEKAIDLLIEHTSKYFIPWIRGWIDVAKEDPKKYCFVKFEELKNDTKGTFSNVLDFYGINLNDKRINKIIELAKGSGDMKANIEKLKILPRGYVSTFRSGGVGQWKHEFTKNQIEKAKRLLGSALIELGYERDFAW